MQKIPINLASEGMVLARDVYQPGAAASTMAMCGKGVRLTEALINRMTRMEVKLICVEGHPVELPGEISVEEELEKLEHRYEKVKNEPRMARVKEMFRKSFLNRNTEI